MKKIFAALMTVLFLGSTSGLVLAQGTAPATTPTAKVAHKSHKKVKKVKKVKMSKPAMVAPTTAPASK